MCPSCARAKAAEARERAGKIRAAALNGKTKSNPGLVDSIRAGDKVTILTPHGSKLTGRAVMRSSSGGWVLNLGGRHGTPGLADERNVVRVRKGNPETDAERKARETVEVWLAGMSRGGHTASKKDIGEVYRQALRHYRDELRKNPDSHRISAADEMVRRLVSAYQGWRRAGMGHREALDRTVKDSTAGKAAITEFKRRVSRPGFGLNPKTRRRNPDELDQAADLYREFHGREPKEILEIQESDLARREYTALGDAVELRFILPDGERRLHIAFSESDQVKLASSPDGRQLYFLGGDQDIVDALEQNGVDTTRELIDLGDAIFVSYDASKWQTDFKPTIWEHKLGEESGIHPRGFFDRLKRRIFLAGGNYRVERPGIID